MGITKDKSEIEIVTFDEVQELDTSSKSVSNNSSESDVSVLKKKNIEQKKNEGNLEEKESFSKRNQSEVQVYDRIREKNMMIKKEKVKRINNSQVKSLSLPKVNDARQSGGFVYTVLLSLIVSFASGALFMFVHMMLLAR